MPLISRQQRFASVGSTNDVVRGWLRDGTPEVCLAVADEQTAGRGRSGRTWQAPPGAALLLSLGFRPAWLPADRTWRLPATVSLAMADAAEEVAGLPDGAIRLKWPNDLVVLDSPPAVAEGGAEERWAAGAAIAASNGDERTGPRVRKLAGVLAESEGVGSDDPRVVVGIGVNADWPADAFPPELAASMTSLRVASHGRPIDLGLLLDGFLGRLEVRVAALRSGRFDLADWNARQATTGRTIEIEWPDGAVETATAVGVDAASGGLALSGDDGAERVVVVGEVRHVRLPGGPGATAAAGV